MSKAVEIKEWSLVCCLTKPDSKEIDDIADFINKDGNISRIENVATLAAFVLIVRYEHSDERIFSNSDIALLARRNPRIISKTVDSCVPDVIRLIDSLITKPEAKNENTVTKRPAKRSKKPTAKSKNS